MTTADPPCGPAKGRCNERLPDPLDAPRSPGRRPGADRDPREALALGKAVYDRRVALGISVADLALRADMTTDEIECIEEGGTEPTIALVRHLAAALDADVRLTPGHDLDSVGLEAHAA